MTRAPVSAALTDAPPLAEAPVRRVWLGGVDGDFRVDRDLAIGPWCLIDSSEVLERTASSFHDPFPTPDALDEAARACIALAEATADRLADELNARHGTAFGRPFWRYVLLPWLLVLTQHSWGRFVHVRSFVARMRGEAANCTILPRDVAWNFSDTRDFIVRGTLGTDYNHWLTSRVVETLGPAGWRLHDGVAPWRETARSTSAAHAERDSFIASLSRRLPVWQIAGVGPLGRALLSAWVALLPRREAADPWGQTPAVPPAGYFPQEFLDLFESLLMPTLPTSFIGRFAEHAAAARRLSTKRGRLFVGAVDWSDDAAKIAVAWRKSQGERLVVAQHGGYYGIVRTFPDAAAFEYGHDAFISWGWSSHDGHRAGVVPLASPMLSRLPRHHATNDRLIVVGTAQRMFAPRLQSVPQPAQVLAYREAKRVFFGALKAEPFAHAEYRPHPRAVGCLDDLGFLRRHFPALRVCEGDLDTQILGCQLLVADHPATTLNIAYAANIPTLLFFDRRFWALSREAEPAFRRLAEAGLFFEDPGAAGEAVNRVWPDVAGWWSSETVQSARRDWCEQFARSSPTWWRDWLGALQAVARSGGR